MAIFNSYVKLPEGTPQTGLKSGGFGKSAQPDGIVQWEMGTRGGI